jgi:hypothetical protein
MLLLMERDTGGWGETCGGDGWGDEGESGDIWERREMDG